MTIDTLLQLLGWCSLINIGILFFWFFMFVFAHDLIYNLHTKWFKISLEKFDAIHYGSMAFFKLGVFVLNIVPYLAMRIVF